MAQSKCGSCNSNKFELAGCNPANSVYPVVFIQCASCGTVVGVMDMLNIGHQITDVKKALKLMANKMDIELPDEF